MTCKAVGVARRFTPRCPRGCQRCAPHLPKHVRCEKSMNITYHTKVHKIRSKAKAVITTGALKTYHHLRQSRRRGFSFRRLGRVAGHVGTSVAVLEKNQAGCEPSPGRGRCRRSTGGAWAGALGLGLGPGLALELGLGPGSALARARIGARAGGLIPWRWLSVFMFSRASGTGR